MGHSYGAVSIRGDGGDEVEIDETVTQTHRGTGDKVRSGMDESIKGARKMYVLK
jgi:hypothetical protein